MPEPLTNVNHFGTDSLRPINEIMGHQSCASVEKDSLFSAQGHAKGPSFLYIEVDSLDDVIAATKGARVVMPEPKAFY